MRDEVLGSEEKKEDEVDEEMLRLKSIFGQAKLVRTQLFPELGGKTF